MFDFFRREAEAHEQAHEEFQREPDCLYAGDKVWVEFEADWDSWDGQPTYQPGLLVAVDTQTQTGLVVYLNSARIMTSVWLTGERLSARIQEMGFDSRVAAAAVTFVPTTAA